MSLIGKTRTVLEMIKFEHSVFALPFALTGALLAVRGSGLDGRELAVKFAWIIVAMIAARSAAMAFNRVADAEIDALNPRSRMRAIPAGAVSKSFTWGFIAFWSGVFVLAAHLLNPLCLKLSPLALAIVFGYSYTKRFHCAFAPRARLGPRHRAGRGLDRRARLARRADPAADGGRHTVDSGIRHHLRLPGPRLRSQDRPLQHPRRAGHQERAARFAADARGR